MSKKRTFTPEFKVQVVLEILSQQKSLAQASREYGIRDTVIKYVRKFVETVSSHLTERFAVDKIRVHDLWHFQHRLIRKILAHTVCVFLNLSFGRPPLDLDGLVSA